MPYVFWIGEKSTKSGHWSERLIKAICYRFLHKYWIKDHQHHSFFQGFLSLSCTNETPQYLPSSYFLDFLLYSVYSLDFGRPIPPFFVNWQISGFCLLEFGAASKLLQCTYQNLHFSCRIFSFWAPFDFFWFCTRSSNACPTSSLAILQSYKYKYYIYYLLSSNIILQIAPFVQFSLTKLIFSWASQQLQTLLFVFVKFQREIDCSFAYLYHDKWFLLVIASIALQKVFEAICFSRHVTHYFFPIRQRVK